MEADYQPNFPASKNAISNPDEETPYPSLSDFHDYEPNLEFDDSELLTSVNGDVDEKEFEPQLSAYDYLESPVSDGTIEENFEEALHNAPMGQLDSLAPPTPDDDEEEHEVDNFSDVSSYNIVDVVGDDIFGRKVIVVSACNLPSSKELNHSRLLDYLIHTLDQYVEQDYSLVYFHYGLTRQNKPSVSWLYHAYRAFDRKYKKNLKALYIVHPTNFVRFVLQILNRFISAKFGRKIIHINCLQELRPHLSLDQLCVPAPVEEYDRRLTAKLNAPSVPTPSRVTLTYSPKQQFGVSLSHIKAHNNGNVIAPILRQCVEYLSQPDGLETEGLFRRSSSVSLVKQCKIKCNNGESIDFDNNFHLAAALLKSFLRELSEPLFTYALYEEILSFPSLSKDEQSQYVKLLVLEKLPRDNYLVLKYLVHFLSRVEDRCELNKMTWNNLAVVFAPTLIWAPTSRLSLTAITAITAINSFIVYLFNNQNHLFIFPC